jgi:hypothetical protein
LLPGLEALKSQSLAQGFYTFTFHQDCDGKTVVFSSQKDPTLLDDMAGSGRPSGPAQAAFTTAMTTFRATLDDESLYQEILSTTSIDQVYDLTDKLQRTKRSHLTNLARIQPYLEGMRTYTGAIDTFVQAKPDILALIWGPIKLLIQWTSTLTQSLDALAKTIERIGGLLREFDHAAKLFGDKPHVNRVLATLFRDILQFYVVSLKFFSMRSTPRSIAST